MIALRLGHVGTKATQIYLHADLAMKEKALARTAPLSGGAARYRAPDALLGFPRRDLICRPVLGGTRSEQAGPVQYRSARHNGPALIWARPSALTQAASGWCNSASI